MPNRLICANVMDVLPAMQGKFKCLIADPPDNIGLKYAGFNDRVPDLQYRIFLGELIYYAYNSAEISWISFNAKHLFKIGGLMEEFMEHVPDCEARILVQTFNFGQNRNTDFGNGFRPWLRLRHKGAKIYPDAVRIPSQRMLVGDKRANPEGKVPLDVWDFPRVTGNSAQRRPWHPTQLHEDMIRRIVSFSTVPGDWICDAFSGSGTVLRSADDRNVISIEQSMEYCKHLSEEHTLEIEGWQT